MIFLFLFSTDLWRIRIRHFSTRAFILLRTRLQHTNKTVFKEGGKKIKEEIKKIY